MKLEEKASRTIKLLFLGGLVLLLVACATGPDFFAKMDEAASRHDFEQAIEIIYEGQEGRRPMFPEGNAISLFLDLGMLQHFAGNHSESIRRLTEAERLIEDAWTRSLTQSFLSFIANDNAQDYPGEDFEDIYISVFNALNFFHMGNIEGAMVEIRNLTMPNGKLEMLARRHEDARAGFGSSAMETLARFNLSMSDALPEGGETANFYNSALARYLGILFFLAIGDADGARIEYEQLHAAFASNPLVFNHPVPSSAAHLRNVPAGQARLNVLTFSGLSPIKEEYFSVDRTILGRFFFLQNPEFRRPLFRLPMLVDRPSIIDRIEVVVDGVGRFDLELLENMGAVVHETFRARFANIFFRTYMRVLTKYIAADLAATAAGERGGNLARMGAAIAGRAAADVTEGADIRMGRFLPSKAHVGGINLAPGTYDVTVNFWSGSTLVEADRREGVVVSAGRLNLIQAVDLR